MQDSRSSDVLQLSKTEWILNREIEVSPSWFGVMLLLEN